MLGLVTLGSWSSVAFVVLDRMLSNNWTVFRVKAQASEVLIGNLYLTKEVRWSLLLLHCILLVSINLKLVQILILSRLAHVGLLMELALEQVLLSYHLLVLEVMRCFSRYSLARVAWVLGLINSSLCFEDTDLIIVLSV